MRAVLKKTAIIMIAIAVMFSFTLVPTESNAATKVKKGTTYQCIKVKNKKTVYCTNYNHVFKVSLKKKKVVKKWRGYGYNDMLKLKGNFLYFNGHGNGIGYSHIYRINLKTNKKKLLVKNVYDAYVVSGKRIYYAKVKYKDDGTMVTYNRVMWLNGTHKKKSKYKAKMTTKKTNSSKYYVWNDYDWESADTYDTPINYYLHTPDGNILLETTDGPII